MQSCFDSSDRQTLYNLVEHYVANFETMNKNSKYEVLVIGIDPNYSEFSQTNTTISMKYNSRYTQLLSYALNDELCFYDMDYVPKNRTLFERPG